MPGAAIGRITERSWLKRLVPSISAASISSRGTSVKNERSIQTASGRLIAM
jgi:hypothetical protein